MKRFALIGSAGYIAPRHLQAIKATKNNLVAAFDPSDSVGIMDSHFPDARFFTQFELFDSFVDRQNRAANGEPIDYVAICSPNFLHEAHMRFALRSGADAICEKPLVLDPAELDGLIALEQTTGRKVNTILQLRLHPAILAIKERVDNEPAGKKHDIELTYVTSRGNWYLQSWKGEESKSGGIGTNIGVHFFDMLYFLFGDVQHLEVHLATNTKASGYLELERARVRWFLSIDVDDVPEKLLAKGSRTYRSITIGGEEIEFSGGFTDLHITSYQEVLAGRGFGLETSRVAIETVANIRTMRPVLNKSCLHPMAEKIVHSVHGPAG